MIGVQPQGDVLNIQPGANLSGYIFKSVFVQFEDTQDPEFLAWFALSVVPRIVKHVES